MTTLTHKIKSNKKSLNLAETQNDNLVLEEWVSSKDSDGHLGSDIFAVMPGAFCLLCRSPDFVAHVEDHSKAIDGLIQLKNFNAEKRGG